MSIPLLCSDLRGWRQLKQADAGPARAASGGACRDRTDEQAYRRRTVDQRSYSDDASERRESQRLRFDAALLRHPAPIVKHRNARILRRRRKDGGVAASCIDAMKEPTVVLRQRPQQARRLVGTDADVEIAKTPR